MEDTDFCKFFDDVLQRHMFEYFASETDVNAAISVMHFAYSKEGQLLSHLLEPVNYDQSAYRCAYLHKYAGFHAAMVDYVLSSYLNNTSFLSNISLGETDIMNICCLGGGPGTDICGLSNILTQELEVKKFRITIVDIMEGWASAFRTLVDTADMCNYSHLANFFSEVVSCDYICDNLLYPTNGTRETLQAADLVTMIKFVSAVKQQAATDMLRELFRELKPGAVVLFIDNAAGGFHEMVSEAASDCLLTELCHPFKHVRFQSAAFKQNLFGASRLSSTTVTAHVWMANFWSSRPTRMTCTKEDDFSPFSTELFPPLPSVGDTSFTSFVDTTDQLTVKAFEENENGLLQLSGENNILKKDIIYKTGSFMTPSSPDLEIRDPCLFYDEPENVFKSSQDSAMKNGTVIEEIDFSELNTGLCSGNCLKDCALHSVCEHDFGRKSIAENSFINGKQGNVFFEKQNKETDKYEADTNRSRKALDQQSTKISRNLYFKKLIPSTPTENISKSCEDSLPNITYGRNFQVEDVFPDISTSEPRSFLKNTPIASKASHLQEKWVTEISRKTVSENRSHIKANGETDYESLSVLVFAFLVYLIFLSYYFK